MFSDLDYPQAHPRRESLAEPTARNPNVEQPYNRYLDDSAYKSAGSKLALNQPSPGEMTTVEPGAREVSRSSVSRCGTSSTRNARPRTKRWQKL